MKRTFLVLVFAGFAAVAFCQSEKYTKAMSSNITLLDSAKTPNDMQAVSANFERIGDAEKTQWLPYYYASLTEVLRGWLKNDAASLDENADRAEQLLNKAEAIEKNSEISTVKAMIATLHMMVDPQQRWQQYGQVITQNIEQAKTQDPNNPRPYYLQGQNLLHTPEQYGGGCGAARPMMLEAQKRYDSFKAASSIHPNWGKERNEQALASCK